MKRVLLLPNLVAGKAEVSSHLANLVTGLSQRNCLVTVYPIDPSKNLDPGVLLTNLNPEDYDVLACVGGDGTLNHTINHMMENHWTIPIGYFPTGSTNDFASTIYGSYDTESIMDAVANGVPFTYDIGCLNGHYFNYVAGFGAFAQVSYATDQDVKNILGYGAYILNGIGTLSQNLSYSVHAQVIHDGLEEEGEYIFCGLTNSLQVAGVRTAVLQDAAMDDGYFECILINAPKNLIDISHIIQSLSSGKLDDQYVRVFKTKKVEFHTERPVSWTLDGEFGGSYQDMEVRVHPKAVSIMINRSRK